MVGTTISHYKILEKLGEGGMGVIYKAHDTTLDRMIALKFLPHSLTGDPAERERFYHEARAAAALTNQNIAVVHEIGEHDAQMFIAMEFVEGQTLRERLSYSPQSINQILDTAIQIAEGLAVAHEKGIVHRDIKPENIIITPKGQAKITDFGLAKLKGATKLTKAGSTLGTAAYMSPEQGRGDDVDQRTDLFSFGVVLYEMLTGRLPFRGEHTAALVYAIANEQPAPLARFNNDVTDELQHIVSKALEKDPADRYQHMDDLLSDLRREMKKLEYARSGYVKADDTPHPPISTNVAPDRKPQSKWATYAVIAVALPAIFLSIYLFYPRSTPPASASKKSIAVIPFKNLSSNKDDEYFSDGVAEEIGAQLSKITNFKIMSQQAVLRYKNSEKSASEIAKELGVATILFGSIQHAANQVHINATLIDGTDESRLWAQSYDRELTQIFAVQSDVAQNIANALKTQLSPAERTNLTKIATTNTEAYQLYLQGRFHMNKRGATEDLDRAMDCFQQAIAKDPNYAEAYAGLASAFAVYPSWSGRPWKEYGPKAKRAVQRALALDNSLAEPHAALGLLKAIFEWDWDGADAEFKKAFELNPSLPSAYQWNGLSNLARGRFEEAFKSFQDAVALDPLSLVIAVQIAYFHRFHCEYDIAIELSQRVLTLDPNLPSAHLELGWSYGMQGRFVEAISEFRKCRAIAPKDPEGIWGLAWAYAKVGKRNEAQEGIDELRELSKQGIAVSGGMSEIYAGLGENENALASLEKAYEDGDFGLINLKVNPVFDSLRNDSRYHELLRKTGLEK